MKKLLSLIGAISVVGSGASAVVACGDDSSSTNTKPGTKLQGIQKGLTPASKKGRSESSLVPSTPAAEAIKKEIKETHLGVDANTNPDTTNPDTIAAIRTALVAVNPGLSASDAANITFSATTLVLKKAIPVEAMISVGAGDAQSTAQIGLQVTLGATDQQRANEIKAKIVNPNLVNLPAGTNPDTTNPDTIIAIKTLLQIENPTLTSDDLAKITFSKATLKDHTAVAVNAVITVNSATAAKGLTVLLDASYQQQADAIVAKITNPNIFTGYSHNPNTGNANTISALKTDLRAANPMLLSSDLAKMTFAVTTLKRTVSVPVVTIINFHGAVAQTSINVTLKGTDQQQADVIKDKIINPVLVDIPANTNVDTSNPDTIKAIKTDLQKTNPTLTDADLATITLAKTTLSSQASRPVKATITVGTAKATITLDVYLAATDYQKALGISEEITNTRAVISSDANPSTINPDTTAAIRNALQRINPKLTDSDAATITFSNVTLKSLVAMKVDARITVGSETVVKWISVTLGYSNQYKADAIYSKVTYRDVVIPAGSNASTANPDTVKALRSALQKVNPTLTTDDLSKITFGDYTLQAGRRMNLRAYITVGSYKKAIYLNFTLDGTDQQYANGVRDEITNGALTVPHGTNPDSTNPATVAAIRTALLKANPMLTADAVTHITFAKQNLAVNPSVKVIITFGKATNTKPLYIVVTISPYAR